MHIRPAPCTLERPSDAEPIAQQSGRSVEESAKAGQRVGAADPD
jgi:hypothetical protein